MSKLLNNKNIHNASWIILGNIIQMLMTLIMGMITSRYLGPENYGLIGYVASYVSFFSSLTTLGLTSVLVQALVAEPMKQGLFVGTAMGLRLVSSGISIVAMHVLFVILYPRDSLIQLVMLLQSSVLLFQSAEAIKYWFQSRLESRITTVICLVAYTLTSLYKIMILVQNRSVVWFAASNAIDFSLVALMYVMAYYRCGGRELRFSWKIGTSLLKRSYPYIVSGVLISVFTQTDKIMLGMMEGSAITGYYTAALHVCTYWAFIPQAIIDSFRPTIMELSQRDRKRYQIRLQQLLTAVVWFSLVCCGLICLFATAIIWILNGREYLDAVPALRILIWYSVFAYIGPIKNIWLICEGKSRYEQIFALTAAIMNVILNFFLIQMFGMIGAAIATLLSQICANVLIAAMIPETSMWGRMVADAFLLRQFDIKTIIQMVVAQVKRRKQHD